MRDALHALVQETLAYVKPQKSSKPAESPKPLKPKAPKPKPVEPTPTHGLGEMKALLKQVAPTLELVEPTSPVVLLLPEGEERHRAFLENVARAISRTFLPAQVMTGRPQLSRCRLVITPVEKKLPHEVVRRQGKPPLLVLAPLANYQNDQENKRALWETLKRLLPSL